MNVVLTQIFGRLVGYVCLEISGCYSESILVKVSDIIMHVMEIIWWGLKRILSSLSRDIHKSAKNQNLGESCTYAGREITA